MKNHMEDLQMSEVVAHAKKKNQSKENNKNQTGTFGINHLKNLTSKIRTVFLSSRKLAFFPPVITSLILQKCRCFLLKEHSP